MRTSELAAAATPAMAAVPLDVPWPVVLVVGLAGPLVLVVGLAGPLVLALLGVLRHRENMAAIKKATTAQLPSVMRWIRSRPRWRAKSDGT